MSGVLNMFVGTRPYVAAGSQVYSTPGTFSLTVPQFVTSMTVVELTGAGGGGGGEWHNLGPTDQSYAGGGGGSGGKYTSQTLAVTPGESLAIVVGNRGTGGGSCDSCASTPGTVGGTSSVTGGLASYTATGGGGGQGGTSSQAGGTAGSPSGVAGSGGGGYFGPGGAGGSNGTGHGTGGTGGGYLSGGANGTNGYVSLSWAGQS